MNTQDYIMRQIQQLTHVLNKILTQVLKIKTDNNQLKSIEVLNKSFSDELNFELADVLTIEKESDISSFLKKHSFNNEHLNMLADILFEVADHHFEHPDHHSESIQILSKCLLFYHFIEKTDNIYSVDRNLKISKIKGLNLFT